MNDLRDRLAKRLHGPWWDKDPNEHRRYLEMADAVLDELGWDDAPGMTFDFTVAHDEVVFGVPYKLIRVGDLP